MRHLAIPLIRHDNQIEFDIEKIENRQFIKDALNLNHDDFHFKSFGFCLNTALFYIILDNYSDLRNVREDTYCFTLSEINEEYFLSNVHQLTADEAITCDFSVIS